MCCLYILFIYLKLLNLIYGYLECERDSYTFLKGRFSNFSSKTVNPTLLMMLFSCDFFRTILSCMWSAIFWSKVLWNPHRVAFISSWITVTFSCIYYVVRKCVAANECRCVFTTYWAYHSNVPTWLLPLAFAWSLFRQSSFFKLLPFLHRHRHSF